MNQYKVLESFQRPFPTDYEARLEGMLSTFNTELKSATLIYMENGRKSAWDLVHEHEKYFNKLAGDWVPQPATFYELCHKTLVPIGCVAEERVERIGGKRVSTMWRLTDAGEKYGAPLAKFSLKTATEFGSLYPILGSTPTSGKVRAPYVRAKIFEELDKKGVMRKTDFKRSSMQSHLATLRGMRFIEYESVSGEEVGWSTKRWKAGKPSDITTNYYSSSLDTAKSVANEIYKHNCNAHEIRENLGKKYSLGTVQHIIGGLENDGFVEPFKFKGSEKQSEAKITPEGRKFLYSYIKPAKRFLADKEVPEIEDAVKNFDTDWIRTGVELYEPYSGKMTKSLVDHYSDFEIIYNSLKEKDENFKGLRPVDFAKRAGLKKQTSSKTLWELYNDGFLEKDRKGSAVYYRPKI